MGERQAKVNEKRQCFKGWETLATKIPPTTQLFTLDTYHNEEL